MTKEDLERDYATRTNMSLDELSSFGMYAVPCDCGEKFCNGWKN